MSRLQDYAEQVVGGDSSKWSEPGAMDANVFWLKVKGSGALAACKRF